MRHKSTIQILILVCSSNGGSVDLHEEIEAFTLEKSIALYLYVLWERGSKCFLIENSLRTRIEMLREYVAHGFVAYLLAQQHRTN